MEITKDLTKEIIEDENLNNAKVWQIGLFSLNNAATNLVMLFIMMYSFFTQNILGLSAAIVGMIAMGMRIFDGVIDLVFGIVLDKTNGKYGKFKPYMLLGNIITITCVILMFSTPVEKSNNFKYLYTTLLYFIMMFGYTMQSMVSKSGQSVLTNNPKQRPLLALFGGLYSMAVFSGGTYLFYTVMASKYQRNLADPQLWKDASLLIMGISFILTILAIIGIWEKDKKEYYGLGEKSPKIKFKDAFDVIKGNKPLQMLIVGASTDKLGMTATTTAYVYFFSNMLLNSSLQGKFMASLIIPMIIVIFISFKFAKKHGSKKSFVLFTWIGAVSTGLLILLTEPVIKMGGSAILFLLILMGIQNITTNVAGQFIMPMIPDITDYEIYRSKKFVPGIISTVFSFIDKLISSFSTLIIGLSLTAVGYGNIKIKPNTDLGNKFHIAVIFMLFILPLIGHICSIISMKYYHLDSEKMKEIRLGIEEMKK